ncbi:MAG: hypothetical protein AB7S26_39065 [Sandaracinaceae bacterium]
MSVQRERPRGLPGGIAPPAVALALSAGLFVAAYVFPGAIRLGPHVHPGGVGVTLAAISLLWLLVAIGKRPPAGGPPT